MTYPALRVENLSAGYPRQEPALKDVSFDVMTGQRVGILGPNGAGKSTLFKAIAGLLPHSTGQISIHGQDCRTSHQLVGYVPQHGEIDWAFPVNVRDVVMMGRTREIGWLRFPGRRDWRKVEDMLDRVGMVDLGGRQIGQLSGGQRQRVFIARALAQETSVLLLDEPFSGVDAAAEEEIGLVLERLRAEGVTILVATHDLKTAQSMFDQLLILNHTVLAYGPPADVFTPAILEQAYGRRVGIFHNITPQLDDLMIVAEAHY